MPSEPAVAPRRTPRLTPRPITPVDVDALVALSIDSRVNLHRPGRPPTRAEATSIVRIAGTRADNAPAIRLAPAIDLTRRAELDAGGFVTYAA
ncbi:MAG TPA: hypothetical protein VHX62_08780 [Solirubrobacteraceae bacterium]|nr:hypothetical protein [Solirubrobacteraceae bacterium]